MLEYYHCTECDKDTFHRVICDVCNTKNGGTQHTGKQQLQAEIALLADILDSICLCSPEEGAVCDITERMRQLSAMQ